MSLQNINEQICCIRNQLSSIVNVLDDSEQCIKWNIQFIKHCILRLETV